MSKKNEFESFKSHFPVEVEQTIQDYATNAVMVWSRYLFIRRVGRQQYAFCTHCKRESESSGLKHNHRTNCPSCGTEAMIKGSGMGRQKMVDDAYLLYYEKSLTNPQAIIARGFYMVRDYRTDYRTVETKFDTIVMYLFEPGRSEMWSKNYYGGYSFEKRTSVYSEAVNSLRNKRCYHSIESIKKAVQGTPFQYCTWEHYNYEDQAKVFDFASKYPCMEYLTKLGLGPIVTAKIEGQSTFGAINWNGKTIEKVLRLTKAEAKEWIKQPFKTGLLSLYSYQKFKKLGIQLTFEQAHKICALAQREYLQELKSMTQYGSFDTMIKYFIKQASRKDGGRYYSASIIFKDWKDYLAECLELGMDLSQEHVIFPNNLHDAHQKTSAKIKYKRDEDLNKKIINRASELGKKYSFEHNGLIVRPAASNPEIFQEGKTLQHCVGMYAQRYANGNIDLFVLRKADEPDKPFYTMEVQDGRIVQCRGLKNCEMTVEVRLFVDMFIQKKLLTKKRTRIDVTGIRPESRQEVAI